MRKHPSLKAELLRLAMDLAENPLLGVDLGGGYRKIRLAIESKNVGRRGGARVITAAIVEMENTVALLYVYDKSERSSISIAHLRKLVADERLDG